MLLIPTHWISSIKLLLFATRDIVGHVTVCFVIYGIWSVWSKRLFHTVVEILSLKVIQVMTPLTFWGRITSSATWPLDSQCMVSCRWSVVWTVLSISHGCCDIEPQWFWGYEWPWPFSGHITSPVTWPLDAHCMVFYGWSFEEITILHDCWDIMCQTVKHNHIENASIPIFMF